MACVTMRQLLTPLLALFATVVLVSLAAVACVPSKVAHASPSMTGLSISPNPPVQGTKATITGNPGDVIDLDWDPQAEPGTVTLDKNGKGSIIVPGNATSLIATAPDGDVLA